MVTELHENELEARVRRALSGSGSDATLSSDRRSALVGELRHRRARRTRVVGGVAGALVAVAVVTPLALSGSSPSRPTASATTHNAPRSPQLLPSAAAAAPAQIPLSSGAVPTSPAEQCVQVQFGSRAASCVGSLSSNDFAATGQSATQNAASSALPPAVVVGERIEVMLPPEG